MDIHTSPGYLPSTTGRIPSETQLTHFALRKCAHQSFAKIKWPQSSIRHCGRRSVPLSCSNRTNLESAIGEGLDAQQELEERSLKYAQEYRDLNREIQVVASEVRKRLRGTSIYLVGMMGSGKSTVGKLVAKALEYPFLDSDQLAEAHFGQSVAEIFENEGEEGFRELESTVLQELMPFKSCVVSTGGGAVTRRKNWGFMQHGIIAWLNGPPELLARRACEDNLNNRPLLGDLASKAASLDNNHAEKIENVTRKLAAILDERKDQYAQADVTISLHDQKGDPVGAPVSVVTFRSTFQDICRLLKALNDRLKKDTIYQPETKFRGFGKPI